MIYQLIGPKYLTPGTYVDLGTGGYGRWGVISSVVQEDYKLPNPCFVSGTTRFIPQPISLFQIHGCQERHWVDPRSVPCVWAFDS